MTLGTMLNQLADSLGKEELQTPSRLIYEHNYLQPKLRTLQRPRVLQWILRQVLQSLRNENSKPH